MNSAHLDREVERFDAALPMDRAPTPPKSWYVEPAMLERERQRVFQRHWQYACPLDLVRKPGSHASNARRNASAATSSARSMRAGPSRRTSPATNRP